ncbi:MAG: M1 family metallopeptidase [Balneolaceae bacterium]
MTRSGLIILMLLTSGCGMLYAQDSLVYESGGDLFAEKAAYNVHYYELDLKVNPEDSTITGSVDIYFKMVHPSNEIALDLDPRLKIESTEWLKAEESHNLEIRRSESDKTFFVKFPATLQPEEMIQLKVSYNGKPLVAENPPWDGGFVWSQTPSGEPWVGVATQTIGAWVWWPQKDHPTDKADSVSINITMPDNLVVASNGRSGGISEAENGWKTWHWFVSMPINNYNVTLNAAPYETIREKYTSTSGDEMEIIFWVLPEFLEEGERLFPQFAEQIRFLEELIGPYPFRADKYGVAHAPFLGMEHQSLIAYGAGFENGNLFGEVSEYDDLHQHELAHEWWGNLVTAWDWRDFWIHEGIGTYMQALYAEHLNGEEAYHESMDVLRSHIVSQTATAPRESKTSLEITQGFRGGDVYYKGAAFLHTLRYYLGEEAFFESLRRFAYPDPAMEEVTDGSHIRFVTTDDFLTTAEKVSGQELGWLFEVYLRQADLPTLRAKRSGGIVELNWDIPDELKFPMPVEIALDGDTLTIVPENGAITFEVSDETVVEADPDNWILKDFYLDN